MAETGRRRAVLARPAPSSPFDAQAALEHLLARLRASAGATRVSVWVHEAAAARAVPFRSVVADSGDPLRDHPRLRTPVPLSGSPFLTAVIGMSQPVVARAEGRRAADRELASLGLRSAHGEPLILDGEVVGVLTVEPAAAAAPHLLRQVTPKLAAALAQAWGRRSDDRRLEQAAVLLALIESTATADSTSQVLEIACRELTGLNGVTRSVVHLCEDGHLVSRPARDRLAAAPAALHLAQTVLRTREPATADGTAALAVPLGRGPHLMGVLTLECTRSASLDEDLRRFAAAAGAHLGAVLELARTRELFLQSFDDQPLAHTSPA